MCACVCVHVRALSEKKPEIGLYRTNLTLIAIGLDILTDVAVLHKLNWNIVAGPPETRRYFKLWDEVTNRIQER